MKYAMAKELTLVAVRVGPTTTASPTKWSPTVVPLKKRTIHSLAKPPSCRWWTMSQLFNSLVASWLLHTSSETNADGPSHITNWASSSSWECNINIKCRVPLVAVMRIQALSVPAYRPAILICPSYPSTMLKSSFRSSMSQIKMELVAPPMICTRNFTWVKRTIWPWRVRMRVERSLPSSRQPIWRRTHRQPWNEKRALTAAIVESIRWLIHQN